MYSACLFCSSALGTNEVIEHFPAGRRLAFDAARGRLWVVCTSCRRWNLTPLEERWEAIEDCERRFRDTRLRVSTGEIGLARLREGLELVRVGEPLRPEIAAWRYGEQFGARRRRHLLVAGALAAAGGVALAGGLYAGAGIILTVRFGRRYFHAVQHGREDAVVARVQRTASSRHPILVRRKDLPLSSMRMGSDGGLAFQLHHSDGASIVVEGDDARRIARQLLPRINRRGGTEDDVARAVGRLEHAGDAERFLAATARRGERLTRIADVEEREWWETPHDADLGSGLMALSSSLGLAIEMALNEEQERLALEGELAELEAAWREAEEIGAIADSLFLPESVERAWARMTGRAAAEPPAP